MGVGRLWLVVCLLLCSMGAHAQKKQAPYKGYTGTVHQFGFIGGLYLTENPNMSETDTKQTYNDFGIGAVYTLHDYVTRQFAFDVITSITMVTAKYLESKDYDDNKKKFIWPVDCRFYVGPSEDFQAYIGLGIQWNMLQKTIGTYSLTTGRADNKTIHQLSGNTAIGFNFFGPQKYMFHLNIGAKFHFPITDNDHTTVDTSLIDLSKDRGCVVLNGGITLDIDRRKNACVMLNYEYPLGTLKAKRGSGGFFCRTQTISLGLMFHIGGTR